MLRHVKSGYKEDFSVVGLDHRLQQRTQMAFWAYFMNFQ
jgi:hypothetical protein